MCLCEREGSVSSYCLLLSTFTLPLCVLAITPLLSFVVLPAVMQKYQVAKQLGDGSYGCVYMAKNAESGEVVAIKK